MGEIGVPILFYFIVFLSVPLVFGYIALRLHLPALVGYIIGGIALSAFISQGLSEVLSLLAQVGLILLLFTIGLELRLESLRRFSRFVLFGGFLQVILTLGLVFVLSVLFGFGLLSATLIGIAFSFSSTAVISKIIQERGEENSLVGQLCLGILIFQDFLVIPAIVVVSSVDTSLGGAALGARLAVSLIKSGFVIVMVYVLGERIISSLFERVGRISRESLNLFTIIFIFLSAFVFSLFGLSASLAAFVAGILVGQTLQQYHVFSQIRPLRDVFVILFFVFLGAQVGISELIVSLPTVLLFTIVLILIKFIVFFVIFVLFRFHSRSSFAIGVYLSQVGEFAFILLQSAVNAQLIESEVFSFAITVTLVSLIISPILIDKREAIYLIARRFIKRYVPSLEKYLHHVVDREPAHIEALDLKRHVIICGYGRVGKYIGRALSMAGVPYIAVDYNFQTVEEARKSGVRIIYGDPTDIDILDYLQAEHAFTLISAVPDSFSQERIILNAKMLKPDILIFSRVGRESEQRRMKDLGARVVVQPEFEAALSIVRRVFAGYKIPTDEARGKIKRLKIEHGML